MYATTGDAPWFALAFHASFISVSVMSVTIGLDGGPGKVEGSGVRWKITDGFVGAIEERTHGLVVKHFELISLQ